MASININQDKSLLDIQMIHKFISNSYWGKGRTLSMVKTTIKNSICFGVYLENQQIGFARVVSDGVIFSYVMDVFILPEYRGRGYGVALMDHIMHKTELNDVQKWMLATDSAHGLYHKFGFQTLKHPENMLRKDIYP